ncbi:MAG: glutamate--tRNA ligase [Vicinamibacterales bacterium]
MSSLRVRFAPSPTGYLHVGGARTALFNWLYARRNGGVFVLRIEDTDVERSSWEMVSGILDGLRWLGLDWDEGPEVGGNYGPYFQSERLARYREAAEGLVRSGHAYYCYCSPEMLKARREAEPGANESWMYDRACARLSPDEVARREASGEMRAIRFRVPAGRTGFDDLVHGRVEFDNSNIEDFVVLRRDGHPTYHLSVVVDDIDMAITDVVRGDDHVSNTPKQVLLYGAFGRPLPRFAHVPLILGPDRKRLSKRHGATSVTEYQRQGYLPEAMVNFLALLGWSPGNDQEIFTREELIEAFSLEGISSANAVFNPEKLEWMNAQHLWRMPAEAIAAELRPMMEAEGLWRADYEGERRGWLLRVIELLRPRAKRIADFLEGARYFLTGTVTYEPEAAKKHLSSPGLASDLEALKAAFAAAPEFRAVPLEEALRRVAGSRGVKAAVLIHATRLAVTGRGASPGLFEVLELLGKDVALERLDKLIRHVSGAHPAE